MDSRHPEVGQVIQEKGQLPDDLIESLKKAIGEFRSIFVVSEGFPPLKEQRVEALSEEEQERLKKFRRPSPEEVQAKAGPAGEAPGTPGLPG